MENFTVLCFKQGFYRNTSDAHVGLVCPPGIPTTILRYFAKSNTIRAPLFLRAASLKLQTMTLVRLTDSGDEVARLGRRSLARNAPGDLQFALGASRKCGT